MTSLSVFHMSALCRYQSMIDVTLVYHQMARQCVEFEGGVLTGVLGVHFMTYPV